MIAVLFGPPGSGKGTQAAFIASTAHVAHVSTGDLLRGEVEDDTPLGREVGPIMASGALVPDDLMVRVIEQRLRRAQAEGGILLDGFPRTLPQAEALDRMLSRSGERVAVVICLDVPVDELVERMLRRAREEGRADDTPEVIRTRLDVYNEQTAPVIDHYEGSNTPVHRIDGTGSVEDVQNRITATLRADGALRRPA